VMDSGSICCLITLYTAGDWILTAAAFHNIRPGAISGTAFAFSRDWNEPADDSTHSEPGSLTGRAASRPGIRIIALPGRLIVRESLGATLPGAACSAS
jgi:hypothetical protein